MRLCKLDGEINTGIKEKGTRYHNDAFRNNAFSFLLFNDEYRNLRALHHAVTDTAEKFFHTAQAPAADDD